jgi:DNA-binding transcriptional ArsR family regulator
MTEVQPAAMPPGMRSFDDIVSQGKAVGDRQRARILQVLHQESYSVGELCSLFDVPQPALSHHLKILLQAGLVARRREGNSIFYRRAPQATDSIAAVLFAGLDQTDHEPTLQQRILEIHDQRQQRSADFFANNAREIAAEQAQISEPEAYVDIVLEMVVEAAGEGVATTEALEVGPGGGELLKRLAAVFDQVTGIDSSTSMLASAEAATADLPSVRLHHQNFLTLPTTRKFDAIIAAMVVHHQASPASFFQQAASLLNDEGALIVAELCRHDQQWANDACGDQWLGFEPSDLCGWAERAGLALQQSQFVAQKNGFQIQIHRYRSIDSRSTIPHSKTGLTA